MARRRRQAFVWVPREKNTKYTIYINSVDVTRDVINSEWTRSIIGLESPCKLTLIDSDGAYADTYVGGEVVELLLDFSDGTTSQWKGKLERPKKKFGAAYTLEVIGSHYQSDLLDVTVTEEYTKTKSADAILKDLIDNYLNTADTPEYTYDDVKPVPDSIPFPTIRWDNKPLWDCIVDLCNLVGFDCYLDSDKNFHFFERESIENTTDAIVWKDNLLEIVDLGTDTIDVKNRIIVYGEDDTGLPIVYQTPDSDATISQSTYKLKEEIIKDTSIKTYENAKEIGDAELSLQKDTSTKGEIRSIILPDINPGDVIWITNPIQKVHGQFRIVKYTQFLPIEQTKVIITKEKTIPQIFKDRKKAELQLQKITNPFKMTNSFNFPFDDLSNIDEILSQDVTVAESNLKISSGSVGTMISNLRTATENITQVHLKVIGDALAETTYWASSDNGDTYTQINLETLTYIPTGTQLRLKVILNNTNTRVDSIALLYK